MRLLRCAAAVLVVVACQAHAEKDDMPPLIVVDPAGFVLTLTLPVGVRLTDESVDFQFVATHSPSGQVWRRLYPTRKVQTNGAHYEYQIAERALADFRNVQAQLRAAVPSSDGHSRVQIGIAADGCRTDEFGANGPAVFSLSLNLSADVPPLVLADDMPLSGLLSVDAQLKECDG